MRVDFQQGIIIYPTSNGQQQFLTKTGSYVSLQTANGRTDITFAHGLENYLFTEASDVPNAWGPLQANIDYWLYWDINLLTAVRTFGFTTIEPVFGPTAPVPLSGLHWFDTVNHKMFIYQGGSWREVVRLFSTKVNNATFTGLGTGITGFPFAGSQVQAVTPGLTTGRIIVDETATPIRRANGQFFTTETEFFINGSPVNVIRLEANVVSANARENIARYQVVKYTSFGNVHLAQYNDTQTTMIAMSMEDILFEHTGTLCVQGVIANPAWNFQTVGAPLWITGYGLLTETDPHISDPITYPIAKVPVGRVLTATSIFFDQGLGDKGDKGDAGVVPVASEVVTGITRLSVAPANLATPIAVGDNDPRLTPYVHPATHPATVITTSSYKFVTGLNAQAQIQQLTDRPLSSLYDVTITSAAPNEYLKWNGTAWINAPLAIAAGTVTSVSGSGGTTGLTLTGGPITAAGTLTLGGTLGIANGGTGQSTANTAFNALAPVQTGKTGTFLSTDGSNTSWVGLTPTHALYGWGQSGSYELGDGYSQSVPHQVGTLTDWKQIADAYAHVLAVKLDGSLWAWGKNGSYGRLGDGTRLTTIYSPTQIGSLTDWSSVSTTFDWTAAVKTDGTLWAWGKNTNGQLGDGTVISKSSPIQIGSLTDWRTVVCGQDHMIAVKTDGTLWACGDNWGGQLGDGTTIQKSSPIQIGSLTNWEQISCGYAGSMAVKTDGTLWGWGSSGYHIGSGTVEGYSSPIQIGALTNWKQVSMGYYSTSMVRIDGTLWGCGYNTYGTIGDGTRTHRSSPVQIGSLTDWSKVSAGYDHTAAIKTDGIMWAWGHNNNGALGDGTYVDKSSPIQVGAITNWSDVVTGQGTTFGLYQVGTNLISVNVSGGTTGLTTSGGPITSTGTITLGGTLAVASGGTGQATANAAFNALVPSQSTNSGKYLTTNGSTTSWATVIAPSAALSIYSWGNNSYGQLGDGTNVSTSSPTQISMNVAWKQFSAGYRYVGTVKTDGTIWTSGQNNFGQLGDGTTVLKSSPIQVGALTDWNTIYCGYYATFAVKNTGTLWAWGSGTSGQLGDGTTISKSSPIQVGALTNWKQISNCEDSTMAVKTDGTLWAWGYNSSGQLGDSTLISKSSPIQIGTLTDWKQVACGYAFGGAIKLDGTLWTWGWTGHGILGQGTLNSQISSPVQVGALTDWKQLSLGYSHMTAVKKDGTLWTWGLNINGQLGVGDLIDRSSPTQVGSLTDWKYVSAGYSATIAVKNNGTLWAWGYNIGGELGDGTTVQKSSPIQIGSLTDWYTAEMGQYSTYGSRHTGAPLPVEQGGTGQTTIEDAINALLPPQAGNAGKSLFTDGTTIYWA